MRRRSLASIAASLVILAAPPAAAESPVPDGPILEVSPFETVTRLHPAVVVDDAGNFTVIWQTLSNTGPGAGALRRFLGRRYDRDGQPIGQVFLLNSFTFHDPYGGPAVAQVEDGEFVMVYRGYGMDPNAATSVGGIFGRRFASDATPLTGEILLDGDAGGPSFQPRVAVKPDGEFVVAWTGYDESGPSEFTKRGIFARTFDSTGTPLSPAFPVNTYTTGAQWDPAVAMDDAGDFVVSWTSVGQDGSFYGVFGRSFDGAAHPAGGEFQVNDFATGNQWQPAVAMDPAGGFVIAWTGDGPVAQGWDVFARLYGADGVAAGGGFLVNQYLSGPTDTPFVSMDDSGAFMAVWNFDELPAGGSSLRGRRFDSLGAPDGNEFLVSPPGSQNWYPRLAGRSGGHDEFVVVWESEDPGAAFSRVLARKFFEGGEVELTFPLDGDVADCSNGALPPTIAWDPDQYDRFRVLISPRRKFPKDNRITSGKSLLASPEWTVPARKWRRVCREARRALFFKVFARDEDLPAKADGARTFSAVVKTGVRR